MFDVVLNAPLVYFFMVILSDPEAVFKRFSFLQNLYHRYGTPTLKPAFFVEHLLMAASTEYCFFLCYYCFPSASVLFLRK